MNPDEYLKVQADIDAATAALSDSVAQAEAAAERDHLLSFFAQAGVHADQADKLLAIANASGDVVGHHVPPAPADNPRLTLETLNQAMRDIAEAQYQPPPQMGRGSVGGSGFQRCPPKYQWDGETVDFGGSGWASPPTQPVTPAQTRCESRGHTLDTEVVTYRDGLIVGHCVICSDRFEIPWWPGGTAAARAEGVLQDVLDQREGVDYTEEMLRSSEQIEADLAALEDAQGKIALARQVLTSRLLDAGPKS